MGSPGHTCSCCGRKGVHFVQLTSCCIMIPCLCCEGNNPSNEFDFTEGIEQRECENSYPGPTRVMFVRKAISNCDKGRCAEKWRLSV
jgi:hypothetical protein